jgi:hypothetical protein
VLGLDPVGDMVLLANDPFRGRATGWDVSLSHDERRTGLGGATGWVGPWR